MQFGLKFNLLLTCEQLEYLEARRHEVAEGGSHAHLEDMIALCIEESMEAERHGKFIKECQEEAA